ncbi:MAG: TetR/AcrR family transcriptional regulator [Clostridiales bacterium]|nr:TetR/AcrR family transcriptional regulator [Clostridiales bacterium]
MAGKAEQNKLEKKENLEQAAYELFSETSFDSTSIDQIVRRANVAKGTFYLYFKDKHQILRSIVIKHSAGLLREALRQAETAGLPNHAEMVVFVADYMIDYLRRHKPLLKIITKNLSWSLLDQTVREAQYEDIRRILERYTADMAAAGYGEEEAFRLLFMVIELVSTVCYSAVVLEQPAGLDEMKPLLFTAIRRMLAPKV